MNKARKYATPLLSTLLAVLVLPALTGCGKAPPQKDTSVRPVRTITVGDAQALTRRGYPGRATATQEIDLAFRVMGPLIQRPVDVGTKVKQGDLVAQIDPRDFQVAVANAQAQLADAQSQLTQAEGDLRREQELERRSPGATTAATLQERATAVERSKAAVEAQRAVLETTRDQLSDTELTAPFDGTVVATYVENFQNVRAKQPIVRILDKSKIEMVVNIPETLIHLAPRVENVFIEFDAFRGRKFPGKIKEIGAEASVTTRTFPVTVITDQPEDVEILPGMAGRVRAEAPPLPEGEQETIVIPVSAVFATNAGDESYVWVVSSSNKVNRRQVQLDSLINGGYTVKSGLDPGEEIATAGVHFLTEGQEVKPIRDEDDGAD